MKTFQFAGKTIYLFELTMWVLGLGLLFAVLTGTKPPEPIPLPSSASGQAKLGTPYAFYVIIAMIFGQMLWEVVKGDARKAWHLFGKLRPIHFLYSWPLILIVYTVLVYLKQFPMLDRSWLHHLSTGTAPSGNLNTMTWDIPIVGPIFLLALIANIPNIVRLEEKIFRDDTKNWGKSSIRSLLFGFMHCVAGVNVATALALSVAGLGFTWHYFKGGLEQSTLVHLAYNMTIIGVIIVLMVLKWAT